MTDSDRKLFEYHRDRNDLFIGLFAFLSVWIAAYIVNTIIIKNNLVFINYLLWLVLLLWMLFYPIYIQRKSALYEVHFSIKRCFTEILFAFPVVLGIFVLSWGIIWFSKTFLEINDILKDYFPIKNPYSNPSLYFILFLMVTLGPISEELFFRGFMYSSLCRYFSKYTAAYLQGVCFGLYHIYSCKRISLLLFYVFIGLILVLIYERRKSILSPIMVHFINNLMVGLYIGVLLFLNYHKTADDWIEARKQPYWIKSTSKLERTGELNAREYRLFIINQWGSKGWKLWKKTIIGFEELCVLYPNEKEECAKALIGIAKVYLEELMDYRRAIVVSERVESDFSDQIAICKYAMLIKANAYQYLGDEINRNRMIEDMIIKGRCSEEDIKKLSNEILK